MLYFDTDSVVFLTRPGEENPSLGDYLGDFKDELNDGDYIVEFASGGRKNYGYLTNNGKEECKVRGISLNSTGIRQLNYQVLQQNVCEDVLQPLEHGARQTDVVKSYHIVRNVKQYCIEMMPQTKKDQMVFTKCVINSPHSSPTRTVTKHGIRKMTRCWPYWMVCNYVYVCVNIHSSSDWRLSRDRFASRTSSGFKKSRVYALLLLLFV